MWLCTYPAASAANCTSISISRPCAWRIRRRTPGSAASHMPSSAMRAFLHHCNLAGGEVVHAADDVDLLAHVEFLDDRRRALQSSHLPSHVFGHRVVGQVAGPRFL